MLGFRDTQGLLYRVSLYRHYLYAHALTSFQDNFFGILQVPLYLDTCNFLCLGTSVVVNEQTVLEYMQDYDFSTLFLCLLYPIA